MNKKKWGRFLGIQSGGPDLPMVQTGIDFSKLARFPASGGVSDGETGSFFGFYLLNPPAGGFADGDTLAQIPDTVAHRTIVATVAPALSRFFSPGLYRITGSLQFEGLILTEGAGLYWKIFNADPDRGWAVAGVDAPEIGFVQIHAGAAVIPNFYFDVEMYLPGRWYGQLRSFGSWAQGEFSCAHIAVQPVHLMDDGPSAR